MWQNRDFLLTTQRLINLNGTDLKRSIEITKIAALTKNIQAGNKTEFVVHVQGEYDYRFDSPKREEIFNFRNRVGQEASKNETDTNEDPLNCFRSNQPFKAQIKIWKQYFDGI